MNSNDKTLLQLHEFTTDLWQYMKKYYHMVDTETYWNGVRDDAEIILQKNKDRETYQLCKSLVFAFIDDLERRRREEIKNANSN